MIIKAYLHSSKEDMYSLGIENNLTDEALENFKYALYEVEFEMHVNKETGDYKIITVDGRDLNE